MVDITTNKTDHRPSGQETLQFRFLLMLAFVWFFAAAVVAKLFPSRATAELKKESCFEAAKRNAYSVAPYAFMRI